MGLFFNYDKPGKGIDKDAPKKKGIFLYFELFFRKFGLLLKSNIIYFLVSLPVIVIYNFIITGAINSSLSGTIEDGSSLLQLSFILTTIVTILWGTGPVSCGYAYLMRSFSREEHVWIWSDFFEKIKENIKLGIVTLVLDIIMLFSGITAISVYSSMIKSGMLIGRIALTVFIIAITVYTFMHFYIYQFAVTFENKLINTYKNSLIMAFASLPANVFLTAFVVLITYLAFSSFHPFVLIVFNLFFWISFMRFPIDFYSARVIKRKLIDRE